MRICVIGAGAMGGVYGGLLACKGEDVEVVFYDTWRENVEAIRRNGLRLSGITGDFTVAVPVFDQVSEIGSVDMCMVQYNTYATGEAAEVAAAVLGPQGHCLTLQNGVGNLQILSDALGKERVVGGLSYHSAYMEGPGHVVHTHAAETWLGELEGTSSERLEVLAAALRSAGFDPRIVDNIEALIWAKFLHNVAINAPSAVANLRVGELSLYEPADTFQTRIIEEALAVMAAIGVKIPEHDPMSDIKAFCKAKFNKASMVQHVEAGRRTEVDSLNGIVVSEGRRLGVPTPFNEALTLVMRTIDARNALRAEGPVDFEKLEAQRKAEVAAEA